MNPPMITDCRCLPSNYTTDLIDNNVNWTDIPWQDCQMVLEDQVSNSARLLIISFVTFNRFTMVLLMEMIAICQLSLGTQTVLEVKIQSRISYNFRYYLVFSMSIILCAATYFFCVTLKNMKLTNFFPSRVIISY